MITEEIRKACEGCKTEEEFKVIIEAHQVELTEEELRQIAGGFVFIDEPKSNK